LGWLGLEHVSLVVLELDACLHQGDEVRGIDLPPVYLSDQEQFAFG